MIKRFTDKYSLGTDKSHLNRYCLTWLGLVLSFILISSSNSFAANKTFTGTGSFSDATKWSGGALPLTGDNLIINGICTFDALANNLSYGSLVVGGTVSGTLNWPAAGTNTLNVTAISSSRAGSSINMANGGVLQVRASWSTNNLSFISGIGTVVWNVTSGNSTLPALTYNNLITRTGTFIVILGGSAVINNNLYIETGIFRTGGQNFTCNQTIFISGIMNDNSTGGVNTIKNIVINSGGSMDNSKNEVYNISGDFTMLGGSITGAGNPGLNIAGNLYISSGSNNMGGAQVNVVGTTSISATLNILSTGGNKNINDLIITSSGTFTSTVVEPWTINGNIQIDGTFSPNTAVYTLAGVGKTISGAALIVFDNITCDGSYTNNANVTLTTSLKGSGTWTQGTTGTVNLRIKDANFAVATFNASAIGNTVNYSYAGTQLIKVPNDGSYYNLTISGSNTKSLVGNTIANGNVTISSGIFDVGTPTIYNLTVGGNWNNTGGTFNCRTSTVTFNSNSAQTIFKSGGETFNHIAFSGTGTKTYLSPITANGNYIINSSTPVDVSSSNYQTTVKGNFTNNGTLNTQSGLFSFTGTALQTIGGTSITNFYDLALNNTSGLNLLSAQNLVNALTISNGTFNTNAQVFTMLSTSSNTARIATITGTGNIAGNVTVQRFAPGGSTGWALLGAPMSSALTFQDWDDDIAISCSTCPDGSAGGFISIYSYNEGATGTYSEAISYVPMSSISNAIAYKKAYWVYLGTSLGTTSGITLDATGTVGKFATTIPLTRTNTGSPIDDGWNLISNPYPSPISWTALKGATANIDNAIYTYNADLNGGAGGSAAYVNGVSSPAVGSGGIGNTIPMCQGFYVHSTGATALTLQETHKVNANPTFLKTNTTNSLKPILRISAKGSTAKYDESVIYVEPMATDNFDAEYDAIKMAGQDPSALTMALVDGTNELQINAVTLNGGNYSAPLRVTTGTSGTYTISSLKEGSFPIGTCIQLLDTYNNITTDLNASSYVVTLSDTTTYPRFVISLSASPLQVSSSVKQATCLMPDSSAIIAVGLNSGPWNYYWKDNSGTIIKTSLNKTGPDSLLNITGGDYIVDINTVGQCDNGHSEFTINTILPVVAQFNMVDTVDVVNGGFILINNTSTNAAYNSWNFGDNSGTSLDANPNYYYLAAGIYTVELIATSTSGCVDSTSKTIVVIDSSVGINELTNNGYFSIKTLNNNQYVLESKNNIGDTKIYMIDNTGRLITDLGNKTEKEYSVNIDLSNESVGVYYLNLTNNKKTKVIKLLVK